MDNITKPDVKVNNDISKITSDSVKDHNAIDGFTKTDVNNTNDQTINDSSITSDIVNKSHNSRVYNVQNLKPFNKTDNILTKEEAKKRGTIGGIKSGEVRRQKKTMRETLENALKIELSQEKLQELGADISLMNGENSVLSAIIASTIREAINGDTKAIQFVRDSIGEQPINKQEVTQEIITKDDLDMMENVRKQLLSS